VVLDWAAVHPAASTPTAVPPAHEAPRPGKNSPLNPLAGAGPARAKPTATPVVPAQHANDARVLRTADLDYELPAGAVATTPASPRDAARLLVVRGGSLAPEHKVVRDLPGVLGPGDLLVLNATRVLAARFLAHRADSPGRAQGLYLRELPGDPLRWKAMVKARRLRPGLRFNLLDRGGSPSPFSLELVSRSEDEPGAWITRVHGAGDTSSVLDAVGLTPLPPYILAARRLRGVVVPDEADRASYQTTYAGPEAHSVAAPTAGLHLTPELLAALASRGVVTTNVILHVGTGTFKPVETEYVEQHPMHEEWCAVPPGAAAAMAACRARGGRVVAVGTTTARALEAFAAMPPDDPRRGLPFATRLLITPGHGWRAVDALMTNFHLPRSTLLALVAARLPGGVGQLRALYAEALAEGYRFFSYGDAMLVLPE
jgi:S-adenosylmethionine:tRNA ribosyltransferase-isomerase